MFVYLQRVVPVHSEAAVIGVYEHFITLNMFVCVFTIIIISWSWSCIKGGC